MPDEKERSSNSGFAVVIISHSLDNIYDSLFPILYPVDDSRTQTIARAMGYRFSSGALQIMEGFLGRFVRRKHAIGFGMIWQSVARATARTASSLSWSSCPLDLSVRE